MKRRVSGGFTLVEVVLGSLTLAIAIAALLGAFLSQITLNEHGRNLSLTVHDANRVIEQLRLQNSPCGGSVPSAVAGAASWDAWLNGQGKSLPSADPAAEERVAVTCLERVPDTPPANPSDYCGRGGTAQVTAGEWRTNPAATTFDPIQVTVAICWRHRGLVIGECTWNGTTLTPSDGANGGVADGVIRSPAMLTTLVTCRG